MGLVNWALELLYKVVHKEELQERMRTKGIFIKGYHMVGDLMAEAPTSS